MEAAVQNVKAVTSQDRVQDKRRQCSARRGGGSKIEQNRSKDESQQIAVWKLLYWIQHLDQYTSRMQVISRPDVETGVIRLDNQNGFPKLARS